VPPPRPGPVQMTGARVILERLDPAAHAADLFRANRGDTAIWDYMPYGPFDDQDAYRDWVAAMAGQADPFCYALRDRNTGRCGGVAS